MVVVHAVCTQGACNLCSLWPPATHKLDSPAVKGTMLNNSPFPPKERQNKTHKSFGLIFRRRKKVILDIKKKM